jgi:uncharacterized protein GlcG (DUF336 family)
MSSTKATFQSFSVNQRHLSTDKAIELVTRCVELAREHGAMVAATAVDRAGSVLASIRDNAAGVATLEGSRRKAYTAINLGMSSREVERLVRDDVSLHSLGTIDDLLPLQGAVLIKDGGDIIGALGVGGASGAIDEQCASDAIKEIIGAQ